MTAAIVPTTAAAATGRVFFQDWEAADVRPGTKRRRQALAGARRGGLAPGNGSIFCKMTFQSSAQLQLF